MNQGIALSTIASKPFPTANPFDSVVLRLSPDQRGHKWGRGQEVYAYDPKTGKAQSYQTRPYLSRLNPFSRADTFRYYLVTANPEPRPTCPPIEVVITDSSNQRRVIEAILFVQAIDQARVQETVASLAREASPFGSLTSLVAGWLQDYVNEKRIKKVDALACFTAGTQNTSASREECAQYLATQAYQQLGLRLACELRLPREDLTLEDIVLTFPVLVKDCEENLTATLELTIHPPEDDEERDLALRRLIPIDRMKEEIRMRAIRWFRTECTLEAICYDNGKVRAGLQRQLMLFVEGSLHRRLFGLRVPCSPPFPTDVEIREDYEVICEVEPSQTKVPVRHRLLLERNDIAKYRSARIPNLEQWIEKRLNRHTKSVLFGKSYVAVIVGFDSDEIRIKSLVKNDVEQIRFSVSQHITIPADAKITVFRNRALSFDTGPLTFKTKDARVEFSLTIHGRVTFEHLERLSGYLSPETDLRDHFIRAAEEAAAEEIRKLDPECLHMRFTESLQTTNRSSNQEDGTSPEQLIKRHVEAVLKREFDTETANIELSVEPTEIVQLYEAIRPHPNPEVDVTVKSRGSTGEAWGGPHSSTVFGLG